MHVDIRELTTHNQADFFHLLRERGFFHPGIYGYVYDSARFNGGLVAYCDGKPAGCIGYVKREFSLKDKVLPVNWFNDWYVSDQFRGHNIGVLLLRSVGELTGNACGIITPKRSGMIALKAGYQVRHTFLECHFPLNPVRIGYRKYYYDNGFHDPVTKRLVRTMIYFLNQGFRTTQPGKAAVLAGADPGLLPEWLGQADKKPQTGRLEYDQTYLTYLLQGIRLHRTDISDFWQIEIDECRLAGYNETLNNGNKQAVLLHAAGISTDNMFRIYGKLAASLRTERRIDQLNLILNASVLPSFRLSGHFWRKLPFYTYNLDPDSLQIIQHCDKNSTWTLKL